MTSDELKQIALECGFDAAGAAAVSAVEDYPRYREWIANGFAGQMRYLTDRRGDLRADPRNLLPSARSVICVAKLYKGPEPPAGPISRYAWGADYHDILREGLSRLAARLAERFGPFEHKICVDTAPLLERSLARQAGLGWIGKNTCLISQSQGSFLFLGELLVSFDIEPGSPPPDRCGTCTRCIDACPTAAIVPKDGGWTLDSRLCISYLTIELRGPVPEELRPAVGEFVFGCDICQDVCPWNDRAPATRDPRLAPRDFALEPLSAQEFRDRYESSPILRSRHSGYLRNIATAMGNSRNRKHIPVLEQLADSDCPQVAEHAGWALRQWNEEL